MAHVHRIGKCEFNWCYYSWDFTLDKIALFNSIDHEHLVCIVGFSANIFFNHITLQRGLCAAFDQDTTNHTVATHSTRSLNVTPKTKYDKAQIGIHSAPPLTVLSVVGHKTANITPAFKSANTGLREQYKKCVQLSTYHPLYLKK